MFVSSLSFANSDTKPLNQYNLKCYGVSNGLPQNSITALDLSQDGHLIVGTYAGVVSFDGDRFSEFVPHSDRKFPKMEVWSVDVGPNGAIWIGSTTTGVYRFQGDDVKHWDVSNGLNNNLINDVVIGKHVYIFNDNHIFQYQPNSEPSLVDIGSPDKSISIYNAFINLEGDLLLTSSTGFWKYNENKWEIIPLKYQDKPVNGLNVGIAVDDKTILLAFFNKIFKITNGRVDLLIPELIKNTNVVVNKMLLDSQGDLWIGTKSNGLMRYGKFGVESVENLPNDIISSIVEDVDGFIWIGTPSGLCSLHYDSMRSITQLNGLQNDFVRHLAKGDGNKVFVIPFIPSSRLEYIENNRIHHINIDFMDVENGEKINSMVVDGNQIYLAIGKNVVKLKQDNSFEIIDELNIGPSSMVFDNDTLWYASREKLFKYKEGTITEIYSVDLPNNRIYSISQAKSSDLVIGTHHGPFHLIDDKPVAIDINNEFTFCTREFVKDELWVCSEGLWFRSNDTNYHFGYKNGITEGHIHDVVNDEFGNIWVTTNSGLYRILRQDIDRIKQGKPYGKVFTRFDESYGMKSSEFNGSTNGAIATDDGKLWFAGQGGVTVVDSKSFLLKSNKAISPYIEHLHINGKIVPKSQWHIIPANPETLEINHSAVYLSDAQNLSFRYKLIPYIGNWKTGKLATYSGLKHGSYELQVQVRHRDFQWSESVSAHFTILSAWYQTLWFRLVTFLLLALVIFGIPFWRIIWLKQKRHELKRLVSEQTKSLTLANQKLQLLSHSDELTKISNRREFMKQLEILYKKPDIKICLALIDIDDFKAFNDHYGHLAGDDCLVKVAKLLNDMSLENCLVARFGGEEFVLLFASVDITIAEIKIQNMYAKLVGLAIPHKKSSVKQTLSLSTGLVEKKQEESIASLIDRADIAMYKAKASGKNRLIVA